jgi:hypothetical protein
LRLGLFVIAEIVFGCLLAPPCPDPEFAPLRRPLRGIQTRSYAHCCTTRSRIRRDKRKDRQIAGASYWPAVQTSEADGPFRRGGEIATESIRQQP